MAEDNQTTLTYRGNCHCKAYVYEVQLPEIKTVHECNCSVCSRKGYLWVSPGVDSVKVIKGSEAELKTYGFAGHDVIHKFCPTCATPLMARMEKASPEKQLVLNVHAIQGLNTWNLEKKVYDGKAIGPPYQVPVHKGTLPEAKDAGDKVYTGSCHCGALTVAVVSKPLDGTYKGAVVCNCSSCERNACIWIYPKSSAVVLSGDDSQIGKYRFGSGAVAKTFCKTCGVSMTNKIGGSTAEEADAMSAEDKELQEQRAQLHPVNIRVLNGVDLAAIQTAKFEGWTLMEPMYQNP